MADVLRLNYTEVQNQYGEVALRPLLPLKLYHEHHSIDVLGLVDSGGDINVLPHRFGQALGLNWERHEILPALGGALGQYETRAVVLVAEIMPFPDLALVFRWSASDNPPLILGQMNFFLAFNICLFGEQNMFEVQPK